MKMVKKMWLVALAVGLGMAMSVQAGDDAGQEGNRGKHRGRNKEGHQGKGGRRMGKGMGPMHRIFMELDDVKAEMEKYRETMKAIMEEAHAAKKAAIAAVKDGGDNVDRQALKNEVEATLTTSAEKMIDEAIRHHKALASLLESNKATVIAKLKEGAQKRREEGRKRRGGHGKGERGGKGGKGGHGGGDNAEAADQGVF